MAFGLEESLAFLMNYWYIWALAGLTFYLVIIWRDLNRLKNMYHHWTEERLKDKIKNESIMNPPHKTMNWLVKSIYGTHKEKMIGKVLSWRDEPHNPENIISCVVATRLFPKLYIPLGRKKVFNFSKNDVGFDNERKVVIIPYNYYWSQHPSGEYILTSPNIVEDWKVNSREINRDLKKLAIDGFASQMASYSSVRPTWGHEDHVVDQEAKNKFGFLDKFGGNKEAKKKEDEAEY